MLLVVHYELKLFSMYLGGISWHTGRGNGGRKGDRLNQGWNGEIVLEVAIIVSRIISDGRDGHNGIAVVVNPVLSKEDLDGPCAPTSRAVGSSEHMTVRDEGTPAPGSLAIA